MNELFKIKKKLMDEIKKKKNSILERRHRQLRRAVRGQTRCLLTVLFNQGFFPSISRCERQVHCVSQSLFINAAIVFVYVNGGLVSNKIKCIKL